MWWLVGLLVVGWALIGPLALLGLGLLAIPRVRARLYLPRVSRRGVGIAAGVVALVAATLAFAPNGRLPIPQAGGVLLAPGYEGRPLVSVPRPAQKPVAKPGDHPYLADSGRSPVRGGPTGDSTVPWAGPLGESPEVDSHFYGRARCRDLAFDTRGRIVAQCGRGGSRSLRLIDPERLVQLDELDLPAAPEGVEHATACARPTFHLDAQDRVVVPGANQRILAVATSGARGKPDLRIDESWDVSSALGNSDCLVAVLPDRTGRLWFTSTAGVVGFVARDTGRVHRVQVRQPIQTSFAVDSDGAALVVTDREVYRVEAAPGGGGGGVRVAWHRAYDRGTRVKPGQLSQGSGTTPALLDGGVVAIADNSEPRMNVVFYDRGTGRELCKAPVFGEDAGATSAPLIGVGSGVLVQNTHGHRGVRSEALGTGSEPGTARVDLTGAGTDRVRCSVRWTNDDLSANAAPVGSSATGLAHLWSKRRTLTGVSAWYLTGLDMDTGRVRFAARGGLGMLSNSAGSGVALGPDGSAYVPTLGGIVRVRDRASGTG